MRRGKMNTTLTTFFPLLNQSKTRIKENPIEIPIHKTYHLEVVVVKGGGQIE